MAAEFDLVSSDSEGDVRTQQGTKAGTQDWTCAACTLINPPDFLACSVCGSARNQLPAAAAAAAGFVTVKHQPQSQQHQAEPSNGGTYVGWACGDCTYHNAADEAACSMCGADGPAATAAAAQAAASIDQAAAVGPAAVAGEAVCTALPAATASGAAATEAAAAAAATGGTAVADGIPALVGPFTLDCGCRLLAAEAQGHLQRLARALPDSLAAAARHFCCPVQGCAQPITHRDLAALLGDKACSRADSHLWHLAAAEASAAVAAAEAAAPAAAPVGQGGRASAAGTAGTAGRAGAEEEVIDLVGSPRSVGEAVVDLEAAAAAPGPPAAAAAAGGIAAAAEPGGEQSCEQQCKQLAGLLLQLHGVLVDGALPQPTEQQEHRGPAAAAGSKGGTRRERRGGGASGQAPAAQQPQAQQQQGSRGRRKGRATQGEGAQKAAWLPAWAPPGPAGSTWAEAGWAGEEEEEEEEEDYEEEQVSNFVPNAYATLGKTASMAGWGGWGDALGDRSGYGKPPSKPKGVGYGGGQGYRGPDEGRQAQQRQAEAARRQADVDDAAAEQLHQLRCCLEAWTGEAQARLAPLPQPLLGVLLGGPLAPLLRLLLHNDSLMDVSGRRQLYTHVFQLVSCLAGSADLLPLLLLPADSDRLKDTMAQHAQRAQHAQQQAQQQQQGQQQEGRQGAKQRGVSHADVQPPSKRPRRGSGSASRREAEPAAEASRPREMAAAPPPGAGGGGEARGEGDSGDTSCWQALQALRLQADLFRRNAERLAAEGDEEDVALVGAILDVSECCARVQEAVDLWRASVQQPPPAASGPAGQAQVQQVQAQQQQQNGAADVPSQEQRQQYEASLKLLAFQSIPLMQDHYFRQQAEAVPQGAVSDWLRRVTKEIATLPGQLPVSWDSAVLVAMDDDRMDVLRAVIFAPNETPYACGAFAFDILLPPEYPNRPPKVQFLTTGGGRVYFNPNLYANGKVCLSLLGTWTGPGWQPGQSTLLQVLISIQSMILGTPDPYFNEVRPAALALQAMEGTAHGHRESQGYNQQQRRNTLQVAILEQLQKPPTGFEEAVRLHFKLKAPEVRHQARQWAREDPSLKGLAAQVCTALDAL